MSCRYRTGARSRADRGIRRGVIASCNLGRFLARFAGPRQGTSSALAGSSSAASRQFQRSLIVRPAANRLARDRLPIESGWIEKG
jgi:hypothetical protein